MPKLIMNIGLIFSLISASNALQCMDENNNPVDWFVVYKYPTLKRSGNLLSSGLAYSYMTSNSFSSWKLSSLTINDTNSIVGRTLFNLYNGNSKFFNVLYNDQPPEAAPNESKGHNKGVIQADSKGGFWLVHSVPHFPFTSHYMYPKTGTIYGQSFLCLSLDIANLNKVGIQLQYNQPQVYSKNTLDSLKSSLPELFKAANDVTNTNAPFYHISGISSKQGVEFTSFAKSKEFKKDLYEDLVAPYLKTDLYVESWLNGGAKLKSDCSKTFKVKNIHHIDFKSFSEEFRTSEDHSKWAVSPPASDKSWICIGDINRMAHQLLRGGGTVCLNNKQLATDYQKIVASVEECTNDNEVVNN